MRLSNCLLFLLFVGFICVECQAFKPWCANNDCSTSIKPLETVKMNLANLDNSRFVQGISIPDKYSYDSATWADKLGGINKPLTSDNPHTPLCNAKGKQYMVSYINTGDRLQDALYASTKDGKSIVEKISSLFNETSFPFEDRQFVEPTSSKSFTGCLDEQGIGMNWTHPHSKTCQSIFLNNQREESPYKDKTVFSGYQSFNRLPFKEDPLLYKFLTNTYGNDSIKDNAQKYLTCVSFANNTEVNQEEAVCYKMVFPGIFYQICCCYKEEDYEKCSPYTSPLIEHTGSRCFEGEFNSTREGEWISEGKPSNERYDYCSITYELVDNGADEPLSFNFIMKGEYGKRNLSDDFKRALKAAKLNESGLYCFPENPQCLTRKTKVNFKTKCTCVGDYCNSDNYSWQLSNAFRPLSSNLSCPFPNEAAYNQAFMPIVPGTCTYFIDMINGQFIRPIHLWSNAFPVNIEEFVKFVRPNMRESPGERIDFRFRMDPSCSLGDFPLGRYLKGHTNRTFSIAVVSCMNTQGIKCEDFVFQVMDKSSNFNQQHKCHNFTETVSSTRGFNLLVDREPTVAPTDSYRCYAELKKSNDGNYTLTARAISINDEKYDRCMQTGTNECVYFEGGCEACCKPSATNTISELRPCVEKAFMLTDRDEILKKMPNFNSCEPANTEDLCVQMGNSTYCANWGWVDRQPVKNFQCVREPSGKFTHLNHHISLGQLCQDINLPGKCFYAQNSLLKSTSERQVICCKNEASKEPIYGITIDSLLGQKEL